MTAILCAIFFISGASALIFETLWFHQAGLGFGNSVWASSLVLSGFMGGLALGNALAARYGNRFGNPLRVYAAVELAIAVSGIGLVYLLPVIGATLAPWYRFLLEEPWILNSLRLLHAFLLLLIPSTAMGITLPLLTKVLTAYDANFGSVLGRLYGWNTLGAVIGAVVGEVYLIGTFGVHGAGLIAGTLNISAAAIAMWLSRWTPLRVPEPADGNRREVGWATGWRWLFAAFLSGFCLLALEVVWFRFLLLFVQGRTMAFALMLAIVLAGISLGGLAASRWLRILPDAHRFASPILFTAGLLCVVSYAAFPLVIAPFATSFYAMIKALDILRVGVPLMFPVSFVSGVFFTLSGAALRTTLSSETATTGTLTLANTVGAAVGSLVGGFIFLPVLGMEKSIFLMAMLYGGIGAVLWTRSPARRQIAYASAAAFLLSAAFFPFGSMEKRLLQVPVDQFLQGTQTVGRGKISAIREGLTETIIYLEIQFLGRPLSYEMLTNSFQMAGTDYSSRRYMKLFVYWPMALHPDPKRALLICYGIGNTAKALTDSKVLETIDVVDLSRDILEMNAVVYPNKTDQPLQDPRVRVHIEDGRYFLQTTEQRFDLITAEPPLPRNAGVVNLYTREYFQMLHDHLAEGGIVSYWLPLHLLTDVSTKAILHAFCDVFEDCSLWSGMADSLMMVGTRGATGPVSEDTFVRQWKDAGVAGEMRAVGLERPEQLGALFIGDADYLKTLIGDSPSLVDNYPKRIDAPFSLRKEAGRISASLADVAAAKDRFSRSPFIKRLWPEHLITATLPYFEFQNMIKTFWSDTNRPHPNIEKAHRLLTQTTLNTLVLWLLGSDWDIQRVVTDAGPRNLESPYLQYHLGLRLISERNFAAAVEPLSRAEQLPLLREDAFRLHIYSLCMSGQTRLAQQLARERLTLLLSAKGLKIESMKETDLSPFWLWMKKTFGIGPLAKSPPLEGSTHLPS